MIAALYIDPRGPYPRMGGVECWGRSRDARTYAGPWPVVAHPPCGPWGDLRHLYRGTEHDCAPAALDAVRRFGGVLEHPWRSLLWRQYGVASPGEPIDEFGGFAIDVDQCAWGHVARKRSRLYFCGVDREMVTSSVRTGGEPTHWVSGFRSPNRPGRTAVPPGFKICSATQRSRTPVAFARWLVELASTLVFGC